ncbi:MAG: enoyl-CoA hydratase-related protein [Candidatus Dormibacteraeota bacterium]|nr:enoyl-CoA hydratase-related protein [Candidatus Dormibacteraeota bacterium]
MTEAALGSVLGYQVDNGVAWLRLNRPQSRNAINDALRRALAEAVKQAERSSEVRALVVVGEGQAFCAGADVREFQERTGAVDAIRGEYEFILQRLHGMPKPTIAAVNGAAAGIGASIAFACDLRYAVPEASFVEAFVKIGLTVDGGATWLLPRLIGPGKALEMFYTGEPLGADEASRLGLVNRLVGREQLEPSVREVAERLASGPAGALGAIKRSVNFATAATLEEAMDFEFNLQGVMMESEDFREGVSAFLEKRAPRFQGR